MSKLSISRSEVIPHIDANGEIMQMKALGISITVDGEEGESFEKIEKELEEAFEKQRGIISNKNPILKKKDLQISFLLSEIKRIAPTQLSIIIAKAKNLSDKK